MKTLYIVNDYVVAIALPGDPWHHAHGEPITVPDSVKVGVGDYYDIPTVNEALQGWTGQPPGGSSPGVFPETLAHYRNVFNLGTPGRPDIIGLANLYGMSGTSGITQEPGFLSTGEGANMGYVVNSADMDLAATATSGLFVQVKYKKSAGGTGPVLGWQNAGAGQGIRAVSVANGSVNVTGEGAWGALPTLNTGTTNVMHDGEEHSLGIYVNTPMGLLEIYVDGVPVASGPLGGQAVTQGGNFTFGGLGGGNQTTGAAAFRAINVLSVPPGYAAIALLASQLHQLPLRLVTLP